MYSIKNKQAEIVNYLKTLFIIIISLAFFLIIFSFILNPATQKESDLSNFYNFNQSQETERVLGVDETNNVDVLFSLGMFLSLGISLFTTFFLAFPNIIKNSE
jgi:hypothetical protein